MEEAHNQESESQPQAVNSDFQTPHELPDQRSGFKVNGNHADHYDGWYDEYGRYCNSREVVPQPDPKARKQPPNPECFENYILLDDGSGFTLPDSSRVYYFDVHGGWFDEYGNYYDAECNPCEPPQDVKQEETEEEHYGYLNTKNSKVLDTYLEGQDVQVRVSSLPLDTVEDDFEKFLIEKQIEWILFEFEYTDSKFNGACYVLLDKANALKLIELNGHEFKSQKMRISVQKPPLVIRATEETKDSYLFGEFCSILNRIIEDEETKTAERFENYILLNDGSGFTLPGSRHVYYFDAHGGWFDEYGNYYDAECNPCEPPQDLKQEEAEEEEEDSMHLNTENIKVLDTYLEGQDVQVRVSSLPLDTVEDDFEKFLIEKQIEWILFEFEYADSKFDGACYVLLDKANALKLIELNGQELKSKKIRTRVQKPPLVTVAAEEAKDKEEESKKGEGAEVHSETKVEETKTD